MNRYITVNLIMNIRLHQIHTRILLFSKIKGFGRVQQVEHGSIRLKSFTET